MTTYAASSNITVTLASLATLSGRRSAFIDNTTNKYDDILIELVLKPGTLGTNPYVQVMAYSSADGTNFETQGSTDAAYNTLTGGEKVLGYMIPAASTTQFTGVFSLAQAYGGVLPPYWGIIVWQSANGTFSATESDHIKKFVGITYPRT